MFAKLSSGAAVSLQSDPATVSSATALGPTTISSESAGGFAMAAVAEEDGRSETVQKLSSDNNNNDVSPSNDWLSAVLLRDQWVPPL